MRRHDGRRKAMTLFRVFLSFNGGMDGYEREYLPNY